MNENLSIKIKNKIFKSPVFSASGTFGYTDEYKEYIDYNNITVVTKGITLKPRKGNKQPRIKETKHGLINCIGLENIGINAFIDQKLSILKEKNINFVVNIAGSTIEEYCEISKICEENGIDAIELNVSCPNVKYGCLEFCSDINSLFNLISQVRKIFTGVIITKLSPNVSNIEKIAIICEEAGSDAISAINTIKATRIDLSVKNNKITSKKISGGLSGANIKYIALDYVNRIINSVNIPVIGCGGIYNYIDVLEFMSIGCSAVQIGTANFTHPGTCSNIVNDLKYFMNENKIKNIKNLF